VARKMLDDDRTGRPFRWIDKCPGHHTHTQPKRYYIKDYIIRIYRWNSFSLVSQGSIHVLKRSSATLKKTNERSWKEKKEKKRKGNEKSVKEAHLMGRTVHRQLLKKRTDTGRAAAAVSFPFWEMPRRLSWLALP
jgi:hypothetical protein